MAFRTDCNPRSHGKYEMSRAEFKKWLKKYDANRDGQISQDELREVILANVGWFSGLFSGSKAKNVLRSADVNFNGVIDDNEIAKLEEFAKKVLGLTIVPY